MRTLPPAVMLMGATATGKTDLAVELVRRFPMEIVSVDSAMVYRGMDIGTAKPDADVLRAAPHCLIDILDPLEPYSAGRFRDDALREMKRITARGRVPLLVGGTMLYFRALTQGIAELPAASPEIRAVLELEAERDGLHTLHERLAALDPESARRIHANDPQRIQRALEVYEVTGRTLSELHRKAAQQPASFNFTKLALIPADRGRLNERIEKRFRHMLELGFLEEVRALFERGDLGPELPSMRAVGYRQAWQYLAGILGEPGWVEQAIAATRQYAKRQMTWMRSEADLCGIRTGSDSVLDKALNLLQNSGVVDDLNH